MAVSFFRTKILILAAYVLAAILPVLAVADGRQQSPVEHAQMMAMAGHVADMPATGGPGGDTHQLLCQQHCLFAAASLPMPNHAADTVVRTPDGQLVTETLARSRATPPLGPPPKVVVI